jgi:ribonuclease Y
VIAVNQIVQIVLVLGLTLVGLYVVVLGRRDADKERESAAREASALREESKSLHAEAKRREERIALRERDMAEDQRNLGTYQRTLDDRAAALATTERQLEAERADLREKHDVALAAVAGLDVAEAKKRVTERLTSEAEADAAGAIRRIEKRVEAEAATRAREILVTAMQRQAVESSAQQSVTRIELPSEEMKGRLIGREGRNIRTFESVTGVSMILEDGVDSVLLSSFDVERREIAEVTLRALVSDGRVQPQRIEAAHAAAVESAPARASTAGLDAAESAKVGGLSPTMIESLGRLRLRTSYGQNVLAHLVECAGLAAAIAEEVGGDPETARRAAFLHDIGKAFVGEREGTHAALGAALALENGESDAVANAIAAHHDEVALESLEAVIVQIADSLSASRPGARREDFDVYVERMASLETMVREMPGVSDVVAMQAGREVRVVVAPEQVGDAALPELARTIARRINASPKYPGEVKVTVIRELRAEAVAG